MKLYHYSSPLAARRIAEQRTYYGGASFEDGLNAVPATCPWQASPGYSWKSANTGALLEFEWTGPIVRGPYAGTDPNTLYDLGGHRLFIPAGTSKNLRLIGMQLHPKLREDAWVGHPPELSFCWFKPSSWGLMLEHSRKRAISRWCQQDLEAACQILREVLANGVPVAVLSVTKRPWMR